MEDNKSLGYFMIFVLIIISLVICFVEAAILMWLWNIIIVYLFNLPILTYWYSFGLIIISNIVFKHNGLVNYQRKY